MADTSTHWHSLKRQEGTHASTTMYACTVYKIAKTVCVCVCVCVCMCVCVCVCVCVCGVLTLSSHVEYNIWYNKYMSQ